MKTYAQTILLRDEPGVIEAYRQHHDAIWPEVAEGLRGIGIEQVLLISVGVRVSVMKFASLEV